MEEPTKSDIDAIFKRLKTMPANKVVLRTSAHEPSPCARTRRSASIATQKILPGHRSPTASSSASIARPDTAVSACTCRSSARSISIPAGVGCNFGRLSRAHHQPEGRLPSVFQRDASRRQCQCGTRSFPTTTDATFVFV